MVGQSCPVPTSWFRTLIIISSIRPSLISRSQKSFSSEVQFLSPARRFETANTTGPTEDIDQGRRKRVTFRIGDSENPNVSLGGKKNSMELQDGGGGGGGGGDQEAAGARSEARFEIVVGSHQFTVYGYSLAKGIGAGKYIASDSFTVAGHEWAIYFYPDGKNREDETQYVSVFIARLSEGADVRALFELTLLDQTEKKKHKVHSHFERKLEHGPYNLKYRGSMWGYHHFYRRASLEKSDYLSDDKLSFTCKVGVVVSSSPIGPKFSSTSQEQEPITPRHHKRRSSGGSTDGSSESSGIDNLPIQDLRIQEKQPGPAANTEMES